MSTSPRVSTGLAASAAMSTQRAEPASVGLAASAAMSTRRASPTSIRPRGIRSDVDDRGSPSNHPRQLGEPERDQPAERGTEPRLVAVRQPKETHARHVLEREAKERPVRAHREQHGEERRDPEEDRQPVLAPAKRTRHRARARASRRRGDCPAAARGAPTGVRASSPPSAMDSKLRPACTEWAASSAPGISTAAEHPRRAAPPRARAATRPRPARAGEAATCSPRRNTK